MDPAGWAKFDKAVIDDWDCNMTVREFRDMIEAGEFDRARLHADIGEVVAGLKAAANATTNAFSSTPPAWCRTTSASPGASTRGPRAGSGHRAADGAGAAGGGAEGLIPNPVD